MSKENLSALANTSAVAGAGTGFWSFLSQNSSEITMVIVILTFLVTGIAHYFDKKIKNDRVKIESRRADIEVKRFNLEVQERNIAAENLRLQLQIEKIKLEIELKV